MGSMAMTICIVLAFSIFARSMHRKWRLLKIGASEDRFDNIGSRLGRMISVALFQKKMPKYPIMGPIHMVIFWGFLILLVNTMILWGRGFDTDFNLWILGDNLLGHLFHSVKDVVTVMVLMAAGLALIHRVILRPSRLTPSFEAALILLIIVVMMMADLAYWGWQLLEDGVVGFESAEPFASLVAGVFAGMDRETVVLIGTIGFWTHSVLVFVFLNLLPFGKHFHVITSLPNVFFSNLNPPGKLPKDINIEKVLADEEDEDEDDDEPVFGVAEVQHFNWKDILDMYSCTECGRCTDNCPAALTNKPLKPKTFLTNIRDHLYAREKEFLTGEPSSKQLIPDVIDPEVVWSCTTCRACEEECPVMISYVDKIIKLRRDLVETRGEPPSELATALRGMETNSNPWNITPMDRDKWISGLDVPSFDSSEHEYLLYVGCATSFDERAKKIGVAVVKLLNEASVSFGYMGNDEPCCGDWARRGGSESNFRMMTDMTIETFGEMNVKKIITLCPHCLNSFKNEYPEFGGEWEVLHHTELLASLVSSGRIVPKEKIEQTVVYHDGCYLGRYNNIYNPPRDILSAIPGLEITSVSASRQRGMCCGAGGSRYFMEEDADKRVNNLRVDGLLKASPDTIASACPYCMTMLSDGLKDKDLFESKGQADIAEILAISCGLGDRRLLKE